MFSVDCFVIIRTGTRDFEVFRVRYPRHSLLQEVMSMKQKPLHQIERLLCQRLIYRETRPRSG